MIYLSCFLKDICQLNLQIKEKEDIISRLRGDIESLQQRQRALKEELAEREGQLRVAKMNLQTAQKQSQHHTQEVRVIKELK